MFALTFLGSGRSGYRSNDGQKQCTNDQQRFCHFFNIENNLTCKKWNKKKNPNRFQIERVQIVFWFWKKLRKTWIPEVTSDTGTVECVMPQPCARIPFIRARPFALTSPELVCSVVRTHTIVFFFSPRV